MPYQVIISPEARDDLKGLRPFDEKRIVAAIAICLTHQPSRLSRSRIKQMQQPFWSQYRLRVDRFRVYYGVDEQNKVVNILRVFDKGQGPTP